VRRTRRSFLTIGATGALALLAAACGPNTPPTVVPPTKPAEAPGAQSAGAKPPAAAEPTKPAAAAPTTAPAAAGAATKPAAAAAPTTAAAPAAAATAAPAAAAPAAAAKGATLKVIHRTAYGAEIDKTVFPPAYEDFKKKTGVTVEETLLPEDQQMPVKILTMVAGNTAPDAAYIHPQWLASMAGKGALVPLDPWMKDPKVNATDLWPGAMRYFQFPHGDKTFGIPFYSGPSVYIYNKTLLKQAGQPDPAELEKDGKWTWEAMRDIAVKSTKGSGGDKIFGSDTFSSGLHWMNVLIWGFGGEIWDKDLKQTKLAEDKAVQAIQWLADFHYKDKAVPEAADMQGITGGKSGRIISGRVVMKYGIKGDVPEIADWSKQRNIEVGMAPMPKGPSGRFVRNGPNSFCVMKGGKLQDESFQLINWMSTDEFQNYQYKVGASIPPRKSQMDSDLFKKSLQPWETLALWKEAAEADVALPMAATHIDIQNTFTPAWDEIRLGKKPAKEALTGIAPKINELLAKAQT
jgi:multiple sugar transport system substrate-binding protein